MDGGRNLIIGLDGVPHGLMDELAEEGMMPNFARLKDEGSFKRMDSSIPAISSTSWGTIITGHNPGEHGVYGFTDVIEGTYTLSFSNFLSFKKPAFWQCDGGPHVILNVPSTYPAQELDGCHVSGFVSPKMDKAVYPEPLLEKLKEMDYRIDVDADKGHKSERLLFKELFDTLEARIKAYRYLWNQFDWKTFLLVFTGTDRLEHFLWNASRDPDHDYREKFLEFFGRIDGELGEMEDRLDEEDDLIMLSDHGMEKVKFNVNVNAFLREKGYLELSDDGDKQKYNRIEGETKAFALEHGRIYLNRKSKYPRGSVEEEESDEIIDQLKEDLADLERGGEAVIDEILTKDEIYHGDQMGKAPDLVLVPNSGYNLRGKLSDEVFEESPFTGMHNREAFLYVRSNELEVPGSPTVEDVVPMINASVGG